MNRLEEGLQRVCAIFLDAALPPQAFWTAIPNQRGTRKRFEMGILRAMGVKAGNPDLIILWEGYLLAFELKAGKGATSQDQDAACAKIRAAGGIYNVIRTPEELEARLRGFGVPLRATMTFAGMRIDPPERAEETATCQRMTPAPN